LGGVDQSKSAASLALRATNNSRYPLRFDFADSHLRHKNHFTMAMTVPSDSPQQQLAQLLAALTQPDTQTIRHAEQAMKPLLKDPRSVPALVEILKGTGPSGQQVSVSLLMENDVS
jgi:hypothetical protein